MSDFFTPQTIFLDESFPNINTTAILPDSDFTIVDAGLDPIDEPDAGVVVGVANNITTGAGDDFINARLGNDTINTNGGDDRIAAGSGQDTVSAGEGNDHVQLNGGNDVAQLGLGNDFGDGNRDNDVIFGDNVPDFPESLFDPATGELLPVESLAELANSIEGEGGNDTIEGGLGNDILFGQAGEDLLQGEAGEDSLFGNAGNDILEGGLGNDILSGNTGNDTLTGGLGKDVFVFTQGQDLTNEEVDIITDFNVLEGDVIRLVGFGLEDLFEERFATGEPVEYTEDDFTIFKAAALFDQSFTGVGSSTLILGGEDAFLNTIGGDLGESGQIVLQDVNISTIGANNFEFVG